MDSGVVDGSPRVCELCSGVDCSAVVDLIVVVDSVEDTVEVVD